MQCNLPSFQRSTWIGATALKGLSKLMEREILCQNVDRYEVGGKIALKSIVSAIFQHKMAESGSNVYTRYLWISRKSEHCEKLD